MNGVSSFRLDVRQVVLLSGKRYAFLEREKGRKRFQNEETGETTWVDERELNRALVTGELQLACAATVPQSRADVQQQHFADLPEHTQSLARMRRDYVRALENNVDLLYPNSPRTVIENVFEQRRLRAFEAGESFTERKPGLSTVYDWRKAWEVPGAPTIMRLVFAESERGKRGSRKTERVDGIISDAIQQLYLQPQRHLVGSVHDRVVAICRSEGIAETLVPCQQTIRRAIRQLSPRLVMEARRGKRAADLIYRGTHKLRVPEQPGEVLEVDAHKLNLNGVDETGIVLGRVWVTIAIDRCTRMIVGIHVHVGPPSSLTIAACLRNAFAQKDYVSRKWPELNRPWLAWGVPVVVVVDNAFENKAEFLIDAAEEIGFTLFWAAPRTPEDKPFIERFFATVENGLIRRLPGNTGLNPQDLGDYDAAAMAFATEADIDMLMHKYVTTVYNCSHHRGLNDVPERVWLAKTAEWEVTPYTNSNSLEVLLGHVAWRVPSKRGIELLGLLYNGRGRNDIIEYIRGRAGAASVTKLRVRFDPYNLDVIWVQDPVTKKYETVESEEPEYTRNLTLARHRAIRAHALTRSRGYLSVRDLCKARDDLQKTIDEILGSPRVGGRRTAYLLNARRMANDTELAGLLTSSVDEGNLVDLLDDLEEGARGKEPQRLRPKIRRVGKAAEAVQGDPLPNAVCERDLTPEAAEPVPIDREGVPVEEASTSGLLEDVDHETEQPTAPTQRKGSFAERMAALGITEHQHHG